jgi:FAD dependent oxidoreductase TIGR03364
MVQQFDDAVVGAGILGLAHAYHLAKRGRRVAVFERSERAVGASVRNFGMLWPIGQPAGPMRDLALRSREIWLELLRDSGVWHESRGSLHVAYHPDEWQVLNEFANDFAHGLKLSLLTPAAVRDLCPRIKPDGLRGGLFSATEICIDARRACQDLASWLSSRLGATFYFDHLVTQFDRPKLTAGTSSFHSDRLWVCAGDDLHTLYPDELSRLGLFPCKLQMLRSQPFTGRFGPMLAAGLTLRHYAAFSRCPSLNEVKARVAVERPEFDRYGIHVMVSQNSAGELIIGDSHEYGATIEPYDKAEIEQLILGYLHSFLDVADLTITGRWHGIYLKREDGQLAITRPSAGVVAVSGVGGAGMTLSFGLAERLVNEELGSQSCCRQ